MKLFRELNLDILAGKNVILDIDGTITYDKAHEIPELEKRKLYELKRVAANVILVSNGEPDRTKKIAEIHEVLAHVSSFQKPDKKVLDGMEGKNLHELVVLGDKFLTDGLLALQTGIPFLHVKSLKLKNENFQNRFIYFVDDLIGNTFELFRLMRPKQWIKNFLVFAPGFFAGVIYLPNILLASIISFVVFSLSASIIYILNDISDAKNDRQHRKKKWRPVASYNISKNQALIFAFVLLSVTLALIYFYPNLLWIIGIYIFTNLFYTEKLKSIPVFDVVTVATMYVMRVVAGGFATGLYVSPWIIACTFFAALFIISAKRFVEFQNPVRSVLKRYTKESLQALLIVSANLSIICYVLYTILGSKIKDALYTSPFVIAVFLIMLNDIFLGNQKMETPETYLLTNRHIRYVILGWIICFLFLIYFY